MAPRDHERLGDWQPTCSKVKKRTVHLHDSKEWSDCTFRFECAAGPTTNSTTQSIRGHKLILAMASPVFAAQFYGSLAEEQPIAVTDIDCETFQIMLKYIYTDYIEIYSVREAIDVYYAAKKYILPYLQEDCVDFLLRELSPHNVCRIYEFSIFHDETVLIQKCLKLFSKKTMNVLKSSHFYKAKTETVKQIVSLEQLNISSELDLFDALLRYSENELTNTAVAQNMATTLNYLFEKRTTKPQAKPVVERSESTSSSSSTDTSSEDSEAEERPRSSVIVPKETTFSRLEQDQDQIVRESLRPCVQQIRFLTLNPREFAECDGLNSLLTNEEIMAIAMNIASKDTAVPMPEGFSKSLVPRNQHHANPVATIRFTVNNVFQMKKYTSEVFCAKNIPWSITLMVVEKRKSSSNDKQLYLRLSVDCWLEKEGPWHVSTDYTIRTMMSVVNNQAFGLPLQKHAYVFTNERKRISHSFHWNTPTPPVASAPRPIAVAPRPVAVAPRPVAAAPRPAAVAPRLAAAAPRVAAAAPPAAAVAPRAGCSTGPFLDNSITFEVKIEPGKLKFEPYRIK